jgi:selenide,water dikinase
MGEIAACNVTNDVFAMNVPEIAAGMLVFLALNKNTPMEISAGILKGIKRFMEDKLDSKISGGHTIYNEWPLIGGEASGVIDKRKIIRKFPPKMGDKLILTKPLGTQALIAANRLLKKESEMIQYYSKKELRKSINKAIDLMTTPSQDIIKVIHSFEDFSFIHAMTDVTGFGLSGHLKEMLQGTQLSANISRVPLIKLTKELAIDFEYQLKELKMPETAGGLLISLDPRKVPEFSIKLTEKGISNWIIGDIDKPGSKPIKISQDINYLEI